MPYVATLTTDTETIVAPTWVDVEREVKSLNARSATLVMLAPATPLGPPEGDHHMAIGGGCDERVIVYMTEDNLQFWNLREPGVQRDASMVRMLVGGQEGDYSAGQLVSRQLALRAARKYFEDGGRAPDLRWVRDEARGS